MSIFMGGLNYQVEHHLFPSMARPHLRRDATAGRRVLRRSRAFRTPRPALWQAYRSVIGYLNTVGPQGKDPFLCPLVAQRRAI